MTPKPSNVCLGQESATLWHEVPILNVLFKNSAITHYNPNSNIKKYQNISNLL